MQGRRRYISRSGSDSLNYGYGNYSNYTFTLPNNSYAVPNLSVYGSGLPSYDVMSRYTSKAYDTQKSYDTPKGYDSSIGSYGYVSRSHGLGDSSRYGTTAGQSYFGTSYDLSSSSHGGSTYDGRSFGTDENLRILETDYDRYKDTAYRPEYDQHRCYTPSKLEDYVSETRQSSSNSNWRDVYNEKYGNYSESLPYQFKSGPTGDHVSSGLDEPPPTPSYYSRYRERHKKEKEKVESDNKIEDASAKRLDLTPSEKLAIIRQRIRKHDDDELERPSSFELSHESTPRSVLSPVSKSFDNNSEHIPRWRQRKALEDLTIAEENQLTVHTQYTMPKHENESESRTYSTKDLKLDEVFSSEIPTNSPLAEWRRRRQEWELSAAKKSEEKLVPSKQDDKIYSEMKIPRPTKHDFDLHKKGEEMPQEKQSQISTHDTGILSQLGDLRSKADAVKNILRQKDSPILRSRYNEAKRRQELSKDSSKDDGSETNSRTSSVDLGSSRPTSSDLSDSSRPSSFIFGTDFASHKDSTETDKVVPDKHFHARSRANVQHLKESVQISDNSVKDIPVMKSHLQTVESPQVIHEKLRSRQDKKEAVNQEKQKQTREEKIHSLLYGVKEEKNVSKQDSENKDKILTKTRTSSKEEEIQEKTRAKVNVQEDSGFLLGQKDLQKLSSAETEKDKNALRLKSLETRPKSVTEIHKPEEIVDQGRPKSVVFGQMFTQTTESESDKSKHLKSKVQTSESTQMKSNQLSIEKPESLSVENKISEQRKRLQGFYKKAQTTDIASLLSKDDDSESEETSTASSISMTESEADKKASTPITFAELSKLSRVERIAKYKEERRKQLAYIANKLGDNDKSDVVPSLFLSARQYEDDKGSLNRSQSVKIDSPQKTVVPVTRSKSLHGEADSPISKSSSQTDSEKSRVNEEVKSPREKYYEKLSKRDHKVSIGDSDNEDETIDQINARTREALSSLIRKDVKKSSSEHDKNTVQKSEVKEMSQISDNRMQNQAEEQKKGKYMFSMEKMRNKFLFGDEQEKLPGEGSNKKPQKVKTEDDSALNKTQKKRRQLPSIPMALGESPETTRPKSSIEFTSGKEKIDSDEKHDFLKSASEQSKKTDPKINRSHRRRQIYSENDLQEMSNEGKESSMLERKGDFVSFTLDSKAVDKEHEQKSSSTSSVDNTLESKDISSNKHALKRYQRTAPVSFSPQGKKDTLSKRETATISPESIVTTATTRAPISTDKISTPKTTSLTGTEPQTKKGTSPAVKKSVAGETSNVSKTEKIPNVQTVVKTAAMVTTSPSLSKTEISSSKSVITTSTVNTASKSAAKIETDVSKGEKITDVKTVTVATTAPSDLKKPTSTSKSFVTSAPLGSNTNAKKSGDIQISSVLKTEKMIITQSAVMTSSPGTITPSSPKTVNISKSAVTTSSPSTTTASSPKTVNLPKTAVTTSSPSTITASSPKTVNIPKTAVTTSSPSTTTPSSPKTENIPKTAVTTSSPSTTTPSSPKTVNISKSAVTTSSPSTTTASSLTTVNISKSAAKVTSSGSTSNTSTSIPKTSPKTTASRSKTVGATVARSASNLNKSVSTHTSSSDVNVSAPLVSTVNLQSTSISETITKTSPATAVAPTASSQDKNLVLSSNKALSAICDSIPKTTSISPKAGSIKISSISTSCSVATPLASVTTESASVTQSTGTTSCAGITDVQPVGTVRSSEKSVKKPIGVTQILTKSTSIVSSEVELTSSTNSSVCVVSHPQTVSSTISMTSSTSVVPSCLQAVTSSTTAFISVAPSRPQNIEASVISPLTEVASVPSSLQTSAISVPSLSEVGSTVLSPLKTSALSISDVMSAVPSPLQRSALSTSEVTSTVPSCSQISVSSLNTVIKSSVITATTSTNTVTSARPMQSGTSKVSSALTGVVPVVSTSSAVTYTSVVIPTVSMAIKPTTENSLVAPSVSVAMPSTVPSASLVTTIATTSSGAGITMVTCTTSTPITHISSKDTACLFNSTVTSTTTNSQLFDKPLSSSISPVQSQLIKHSADQEHEKLKHSADHEHAKQMESKSVSKQGNKEDLKSLHKSKSFTEKDSPLHSPRSPRIKTVGVLADTPDLDDILMENVDYLSDIDICTKEELQPNPVAQALSAGLQQQHKTKRSLRKKLLQRSKSDADKHQREGLTGTKGAQEQKTVTKTTEDLINPETALSSATFVTEEIKVLEAKPEGEISSVQKSVAMVAKASSLVTSVSKDDKETVKSSTEKPNLSHTSSIDLEIFPKELQKSSTQSSQIVDPKGDGGKVTADSFEEVPVAEDYKGQRRRKDKSSKRKSSLNKSEGLSGGDKPSISSSFSSDSSDQVSSKSPVTNSTSNHYTQSQHGNHEHGKSVLDNILPSKFSFPSKVSSAISKFSNDNEAERKPDDTNKAPPKITRKNNFSSLLQRFSSPEPQDVDQSSRKQAGLKRQEACAISSGSSDESHRSTPERSQSLRIKRTPPPDDIETRKGVQRSESFKSDFMRRRYSPEPVNRRALPDIPDKIVTEHVQSEESDQQDDMKSSRIYLCTSSDKPTDELAEILKQRKQHVKVQQKDGAQEEKDRITSKNIEKAENLHPAADVDEVIENTEVLSILKTRRQATDSKILNGEQNVSVSNKQILQSSQAISKIQSDYQSSNVQSNQQSERKLSFEQSNLHVTSSIMAPPDDKKSEIKSDLTDIDTSLAVLEAVSQDLGPDSKRKLSAEDIGHITKALSTVDIDSPQQVSTFIKEVRRSSIGKIENDSSSVVTKDEICEKSVEEQTESKTVLRHNKVEELRKSPERKSRMSASLLEKVKATEAKLASLGTVNLKRSESYGRKEGESHRPKGILKRTASMKKAGVVVDPELATILQRRRSRHEDEPVEVEKETRVTPSAKDDIKESLRREQAQRSSASQEDDEDIHMPSITERIFHMETKLEETRSCPITPKSRSGATTPKFSSLYRSGSITSQDQEEAPSVTGNHLLQKLNNLVEQRSSVEEKRRSFQKRPRDDWRTRTQPVTLEELEEAGNLASVQSFRAEVLRKASSNVFELLQKQDKQIVYSKKPEFPQHLPRKRRNRITRHKTLPITAAELGSVPESEEISLMSFRLKAGYSESKADSGILSGSDLEGYDSARSDSSRSLSLDAELNDDDPARLSVSAKASMFKQLSEEKTKKSASGAKRYIDRKKRERSRTLPVTDDEVHSAAEIADGESEYAEADNKPLASEETEGVHDEKSKRSLAEKVQLFQNLKQEEAKPNIPPPVARRRKGKLASRFNTQPVTFEEVEKAAKISPLAMSLAKPPDPELLQGLSLSAQRELMARHAEASLSQPGSRSSSRHGSMGDLSDESKKGILKSMEKISVETTEVHGILKPEHHRNPERDVKSILKPEHAHLSETEQRSILKHSDDVPSKSKSVEQRGILKHEEETKVTEVDKKSVKAILKHEEKKISDSDKMFVKPILKHEDEKPSESDKKPVKPILKHEDEKSSETRHETEGSVKAILRKAEIAERKAKSEEVKPILKHFDATDVKHLDASDDTFKTKDFDKKRKSIEEELHFTSILKHTDAKDVEKPVDVKGVLKKDKSLESILSGEPKGILKKESSFESKVTEPEKSSLKKSPSREFKDQKLHGILHKTSQEENLEIDAEMSITASFELQSETVEDTESLPQKKRGRDPAEKERYLSQPVESTPEKSPETPRKFKYTGRNKTQPITPEEKRDAEIDAAVSRSGSLQDRLNLLKTSGEEEWKKRVSKPLDLETSPMEVRLREKVGPTMARPSSIADRLNLLNTAQAGWKGRVEETDAKTFTVAHKLAGQVEDSPIVRKLKAHTKKDPTAKLEPKESSLAQQRSEEPEEPKGPVKVTVPDINDDSIRSFFHSREITELSTQKLDVSIDDFNELFILANDMLPSIHRIRPKRRHQGSTKNPLRSIHTSVEIKTEYEEVTTGVAEREAKRIKTEQISRGAGFAEAALAGLASREDFSNVNLRRTDSLKGLNTIDPYKDLMLLHIKGRRRTQVRLVEPVPSSINSGDCYVLVTPDKIIQWIGEYSNVIEKAKAADIATYIQQKKDLGCKSPTIFAVVEEKKQYMGAGKHFWSALGGQATVGSAGPPEEDELYENHIVETNLVYRLEENALVPYRDYWGCVPKIEMLKKDEVIVFDFGSELYVWQGKAVKPDQRKLGVKLARKLWETGYDYSAALINPLCPLKTEECGGLAMAGSSRPDWALFGKVNQNMETILFREKFADWPDNSRLIKVKGQDEMSGSKVDLTELRPYDANLMLKLNETPVTLVLEGSHVGRGTEWDEDMDGFIRKQSIVTLGVKVWHVLEYDHFELPETSYGQFHDGDTYVVRWQYMISNKESKDLKGVQSRRSLVGRERCAYFFWQGKNSTINEKGASALMTVELDEERGPQIRVDEGKEIPCFLNLFNGETIIHIGKREDESTNTQGPWKCYCVRNVLENEMCLIEVEAQIASLRSRSSFLLLNIQTGKLYVWHGCQSPKHTKNVAMVAAEKIKTRCPLEVGLGKQASVAITELEEGKETLDFWRVMEVSRNDRSSYSSLLTVSKETQTIRLFHMSSVSGTFDVQEILNPTRVPGLVSPFPVLQSDLYRTSQPELFMLDSGDVVYLWHGWWPEGTSEVENVQTGSAQAKYNLDRQCAMQTAIEYCKVKSSEKPPRSVAVYAGLEPLEFTNLFPYWEVNRTARELNLKDGKKENELTPLEIILQKMMQTRYTFEELQERPLPEGVDALRLESYLDDDEFEEILQMTKDEFYALPAWKQHATKKDVGLF